MSETTKFGVGEPVKATTVKIGIGLPNLGQAPDPVVVPEWARRAEDAGFSTLVAPGAIAWPSVPETVTLAAAAGATSRIGLFSGVSVAPAWPPVLLAKEAAGIDAVSGGRFTLGIGVGGRPTDFVAEGYPAKGRGKRLDADLEVYRSVWNGDPVGDGESPAVPAGARQVPLIFGGTAPAAFARMAEWGEGYVSMTLPAPIVAGHFDAARTAWTAAGREGTPRLVAITYFALGDPDRGADFVSNLYAGAGDDFIKLIVGNISHTPEDVREKVKTFADLGVDEIIFSPATGDPDEVERLAHAVL